MYAIRSYDELFAALADTLPGMLLGGRYRVEERIDRDSLAWSEEGVNSSALQSTAYLSELAGSLEPTGWGTPSTTNPESCGFGYRGRDDADLSYNFV